MAIEACDAVLTSSSRSSSWKRCRWSSVSSCSTPIAWRSRSSSGAHITERMRKSAMLWLISKRTSFAASAERIASFVSITWRAIVRLTRIVSSRSSRRSLVHRGTSVPRSSIRPMNPRSACTKMRNRLSSTWGNTWSSAMARPRLCVISIKAFSLVSAVAANWGTPRLEITSSFDMIVELETSPSSTRMARELDSSIATVAVCDWSKKVKITSQTRMRSPLRSFAATGPAAR